MRKTKSWKHNCKDRHQYEKFGGKRNTEKYDTPFMLLDEQDKGDEKEVE